MVNLELVMKPLDLTEINSLLTQVDLQNIFDGMTRDGRISILVVVKPAFPGASTWNVYNRMNGTFVCSGNMQTCLHLVSQGYGLA